MVFQEYSKENLLKVAPLIAKSDMLCNDVSVGSFLLWHKGVDLAFAVENETLIVRQNIAGEPAFSYPVGKDEEGALLALAKYTEENDLPLMIYGADETRVETLRRVMPYPIRSAYERKWSDYLYRYEDIHDFAGKKYAGQRNHIHKFNALFPNAVFRKFERDDLPAVRDFLKEYGGEHGDGGQEEKSELLQTEDLLDCLFDYPFETGLLLVNGNIAAITIGEIVGRMLVIHTEKALRKYEGAYPAIFHLFVCSLENRDLEFVNREDDSDDPGLRTSKTQYHPVRMVNKYLVKVNSPVCRLTEIPTIKGERISLRKMTEKDKPDYLALSLDDGNNRFWGYDYREDESITGQIDENTFYDRQAFDYTVGDAVNFAIDQGGKMIGETIVYRFTMGGTAEIGCRVAAAYHGEGIGDEAFGLTKKFAEDILGVRPVARCYKQNLPSEKMIVKSGMKKTGEDDTFFYFSVPSKE